MADRKKSQDELQHAAHLIMLSVSAARLMTHHNILQAAGQEYSMLFS